MAHCPAAGRVLSLVVALACYSQVSSVRRTSKTVTDCQTYRESFFWCKDLPDLVDVCSRLPVAYDHCQRDCCLAGIYERPATPEPEIKPKRTSGPTINLRPVPDRENDGEGNGPNWPDLRPVPDREDDGEDNGPKRPDLRPVQTGDKEPNGDNQSEHGLPNPPHQPDLTNVEVRPVINGEIDDDEQSLGDDQSRDGGLDPQPKPDFVEPPAFQVIEDLDMPQDLNDKDDAGLTPTKPSIDDSDASGSDASNEDLSPTSTPTSSPPETPTPQDAHPFPVTTHDAEKRRKWCKTSGMQTFEQWSDGIWFSLTEKASNKAWFSKPPAEEDADAIPERLSKAFQKGDRSAFFQVDKKGRWIGTRKKGGGGVLLIDFQEMIVLSSKTGRVKFIRCQKT